MSRKRQKRQKRKPQIAKEQAEQARRQNVSKNRDTPNGRIIRNLMVAESVKGNHKDYVIIAGNRLVDWQGSYDIVRSSDGKTMGVDGMALIHKSRLSPIVGDELAKHFWRSGVGRVYHG